MEEVAKGNQKAFRQLYRTWQPQLASFIFRITRSKELTAEVVQDVFMKIWITRETLETVINFRSYLYTVSKNQAINAFHKTMRELKNLDRMNAEKGLDFEDEALEHDQFQLLSIIDDAINQLPPKQKQVYLYHRHEKMTYVQIAEKLGISRETVKTHLDIAVKSIKKYLTARTSLLLLLIEVLSKKI